MRKNVLLPLVLSLATASLSAHAEAPAGFDARVESLRQAVGVPGMAVAIVENGKVTLARGFGVRKLGAPAKVDADTLFPTGSTGKAMTAAALATLVDAGKLNWDDKVVDRLPGFQMHDPWVTREMTMRDLLTHRSGLGLGGGDMLFVPRSNLSRAESVRRLRFIPPKTSFRSTYAYSNAMYMVAGQVVEAVSGERWEDYTLKYLLHPAGMMVTTTDNENNFATEDRAWPHARLNGPMRGAGDQEVLDERNDLGRNAAPAGGIASSANDLAKWLQVLLNDGKTAEGKQVFSAKTLAEMWKPQIVTPTPTPTQPPELKEAQATFTAYGLGWSLSDYRGARLISHGGAVFGFQTVVALLPEKKVGLAITINSEDGELVVGLMNELLDHYLGKPNNDWPAKYRAVKKEKLAKAAQMLQAVKTRPAGVGPSVPAANVAGVYTDPWYGNIDIAQGKDGLVIDFKSTPRMVGKLEHFQYDTYVTRFDDKAIEPAYVSFALDKDGKVERVTMAPESPIADFSWTYRDLNFTPAKPGK
jgi:CubicO group peptidase (beta-lactamase class C family)